MLELYNPKVVSYDCILEKKPGLYEGAIRLGVATSVSRKGANPVYHRVDVLVGTKGMVAQLEGYAPIAYAAPQKLEEQETEEQTFSRLFGVPIKILEEDPHLYPPLCVEIVSSTGFLKGDGQLILGGLRSLETAAARASQKNHNQDYIKVGRYYVKRGSAETYRKSPTPLHKILEGEVTSLDRLERDITGTSIYIAELSCDLASMGPERH